MVYKYSVRLYIVFKPSFKYFKNQKTSFCLSILKLETLLFQNIFIPFYNILFLYSVLDSNKKKKVFLQFKNMPFINSFLIFIN